MLVPLVVVQELVELFDAPNLSTSFIKVPSILLVTVELLVTELDALTQLFLPVFKDCEHELLFLLQNNQSVLLDVLLHVLLLFVLRF